MQLRHARWYALPAVIVLGLAVSGCNQKRWTDVEYVPTPQPVVVEMLKMAGVTKDDFLCDLGSGDGRIVITAAKMFGARGLGVDLDPALVRKSNRSAAAEGVSGLVKFTEGDFFRTDLGKATVVSLYLTPELNLKLRPKLLKELKVGARIVSHDFNMGAWRPDDTGRVRDVKYEYPDRTYMRDGPFYLWVVPADVAGRWQSTLSGLMVEIKSTLQIDQEFQEIKGEIKWQGRVIPITDARLTGDRLQFTARDDAAAEKAVLWFTGRAVGNVIAGNVEIYGGPSAGNYRWDAKR